jgi:hypothetical protein
MTFLAYDNLNRRRAKQPICLDRTVASFKNGVPSSSERREIGNRCACDKSNRALVGQVEHLEQPPLRDLLQACNTRRRCIIGGVLVPRCNHPVSGERDRQGSADDEAKESRTGQSRAWLSNLNLTGVREPSNVIGGAKRQGLNGHRGLTTAGGNQAAAIAEE